ncbi:MAG: hypothetical protein JNK48_35050 [Bryobacterales bacterium]|nr:hypothetical protein [Bryobacterales bacterium]
MDKLSLEQFWRSLINDGLAGGFDSPFHAELTSAVSGLPPAGNGPVSAGAAVRGVAGALLGTGGGTRGVGSQILQAIPLAGGILRQFLGRDPVAAAPEPMRYVAPAPIAVSGSLMASADLTGTGTALGSRESERSTPAVVIQVNAMDSRSILDRSDDIANAVRQAMLTYQPFDDLWR